MTKKTSSLTAAEKGLIKRLEHQRSLAQTRFPLLFGLLITFGFISTLNGFERLVENTWLYENPIVTFLAGLTTLMVTGAAYRKLN